MLFLVALVYVIAVGVSDSYVWSQYLFWVPAEAWALAIVALAMLAAVLVRGPSRRRWARVGPLAVAALVVLHLLWSHWRLPNAVLRSPGPTALRVYHWNATEATDASLQDFLRACDPFGLERTGPAVVVLANPPLRLDWAEIARMLTDERIAQRDLARHVRRGGRFVVISGSSIIDAGWTGLDLRGRTSEPDLIDNGTAIFVTLELDGGPTTVWGWDWPSEPKRSRMGFVAPSREALAASTRVTFSPTAAGPMQRSERSGFPPPHVVVGDFNTARGSAAIARLLPGLESAHAQAGIGPDYGWPRFLRLDGVDRSAVPFLGLDQSFVDAKAWRATAYRMIDTGQGTHRAQELILTPAR
jgi:hypothetical protein